MALRLSKSKSLKSTIAIAKSGQAKSNSINKRLLERVMEKQLDQWEKEFLNKENWISEDEFKEWKSRLAQENLGYDHQRMNVAVHDALYEIVPTLASAIRRGTNANEHASYNLIIKEFADRYIWSEVIPYVYRINRGAFEAMRKHAIGDFYVHKHPDAAIVGYCVGHDIRKILKNGLRYTGQVNSKPAKHFLSAVNHIKEFLIHSQTYFTGAQAVGAMEMWLAPFVAHDKLDYNAVKQALEILYFELNHPWRVAGQCFDKDTLILTKEGWKGYKEVKEGELIWTYNLKTNRFELKPVLKKFVWPKEIWSKQGIVRLKSRSVDIIVTRTHRLVWKHWNSKTKEIGFNSINELLEKFNMTLKTNGIMNLTAGFVDEKDHENVKMFNETELILIGLILSDGYFKRSGKSTVRIGITQSKKKFAREIKAMLDEIGQTYYEEVVHGTPMSNSELIEFQLHSSEFATKINELVKPYLDADLNDGIPFSTFIKKKLILELVTRLSMKELRYVVYGYALGDGLVSSLKDFEEGLRKTFIIYVGEDLYYELVMLLTLAGFTVSVKNHSENGKKKRVYVLMASETKTESLKIDENVVEYNDIVWSVNTENETVIAWKPGQTPIITGNSPFTNNTVYWLADKSIQEQSAIIDGKETGGKLEDFEDEVDKVFRAIFEIEKEGDAFGSPFTYPIQNVMMTEKLIKWIENDPERFENFYLAAGMQGAQYFENAMVGTKNGLGEDSFIDPDVVQAMCCRGLWSKVDAKNRTMARAIFGIADETGSKGIVTLNLPRFAMECKGDKQCYLERIEEEMRGAALEWLKFIHKWYLWLRWRAAPDTFRFINFYQPYYVWRDVFNLTFGAMGMTDAAHILFDEEWTVWQSEDYGTLRKLVRDYVKPAIVKMKEVSLELKDEIRDELGLNEGLNFENVPDAFVNVEEVPAETAGSKLLLKDLKKFGREKLEKYVNLTTLEELGLPPTYINTIVPYYAELPIDIVAELEGYVQRDFTGGVMHHFRFADRIRDPEIVSKIVKRILSHGVINFSITPRVCTAEGCFTRIVGWMVKISNFSDYRKAEFSTRVYYDPETGEMYRFTPDGKRVRWKRVDIDPFANIL